MKGDPWKGMAEVLDQLASHESGGARDEDGGGRSHVKGVEEGTIGAWIGSGRTWHHVDGE